MNTGEQIAGSHGHEVHLPPRSIWPLVLTLGIGLLTFAFVAFISGRPIIAELLGLSGGAVAVVSLMAWAHSVVMDKKEDRFVGRLSLQQKDLIAFLIYFLIAEAAIFGGLFTHYFYHRHLLEYWPPAGTPEISTHYPAIATLILMFSSLTCEFGLKAIEKGNKFRTKSWLLFTVALGLIFLSFQGFEWGVLLNQYAFTVETNIYGTMFYMMTGFHGLHVAVGIIFLILAYGRLELGHMNEKRHFSIIAASWYWHFVDVIWVLLFFSLYLI
ncbi:MAG: heme-copper oxidase subunit III [Candidatus Glassbacteria bacterium]|nr:heme-copper oxidase subunit III [Candidatus Glassbacteria bacterium]